MERKRRAPKDRISIPLQRQARAKAAAPAFLRENWGGVYVWESRQEETAVV